MQASLNLSLFSGRKNGASAYCFFWGGGFVKIALDLVLRRPPIKLSPHGRRPRKGWAETTQVVSVNSPNGKKLRRDGMGWDCNNPLTREPIAKDEAVNLLHSQASTATMKP